MSAVDDLLASIFESKRPSFYAEFEGWLRASRRFRGFAHEYRNKIRAKLNNAKHAGALDDLRAELQAAALLFGEQRFEVEYEHYAAAKQRGPDFTINFKSHTPFNVEVRRLPADHNRLAAVICEKTGQLPPSIINLLWLASGAAVAEPDLWAAIDELSQAAARKDDAYFQKRGVASASEFAKQNARLSGVLLYHSGGQIIWTNPKARHTAPSDLINSLKRLG